MKEDVQIKRLKERLCVEQERRRVMAGRECEAEFEYDLSEDWILLSDGTAAKIGIPGIVTEFLKEDKMSSRIFPADEDIFRRGRKRMLRRQGKGKLELRLKLKHQYEWYRIIFSSIVDEGGEVVRVIGCIVNIEKRKEALRQMKNNLQRDKITGVKNAFATQHSIEEYIEENGREECAVLSLKITGMEQIFEKLGKIFAGAVLQNIGEVVKGVCSDTDIIGRVCADEFLIFMKKTDEDTTGRKAEDICRMAGSLYIGENKETGIQANVGLAYFPQDGKTYQELYQRAQTAAEYARHLGNGSIMAYHVGMKAIELGEKIPVFPKEKEIGGDYDMEFLSFAFALLSHAQDMNSAINLLVERIGTRYDLSGVYILEKDWERKQLILTNFWERETGVCSEIRYVKYEDEKELGEFDQTGFLCMEDCDAAGVFKKRYHKLSRKQVKSIIGCNFEDTVLGEGSVYFTDCRRKRLWTQNEKSTLYECSKIISAFVFLKKGQFRERKKITELLRRDQLTGLLNRQTFEGGMNKILDRRNPREEYGLVFCDINDIEYVNSNFGMEAGNQVLCDYAGSLKEREGILLACRVYSDYFMALYRGESIGEIQEDIRRGDEEFVQQQKSLYPASNLSLSTGVCFWASDEKESDTTRMIENANMARKRAKDEKHNQVKVYHQKYRKEKEHEQEVAGSIYNAMNNQELEVFLQPKFSLTTRRIIGAEALARWRRKDGTIRMPGEFIPVLEKVGYIVEVDFYMYEKVLACMKKWRAEGKLLLPVSVNFSRCHIQYSDFVKRICTLAEKYNIEPELIEIEITESSLSGNSQKMIEDLSELQEKGFKVDIDDFGTGYSSLGMLLHAPVDTVKVDRSFLQNIDSSEKERRYVDRLGHLISAAEKEIIFEGVETEHQAKILVECGYTMAQGYLFGKPVTSDEFDRTYMVRESG